MDIWENDIELCHYHKLISHTYNLETSSTTLLILKNE